MGIANRVLGKETRIGIDEWKWKWESAECAECAECVGPRNHAIQAPRYPDCLYNGKLEYSVIFREVICSMRRMWC